MRTTSQTTNCIACGSKDVSLVSMSFMGDHDAKFPICRDCETYLKAVYEDPSFGRAFVQFIGVTAIERSHRHGGAFSCMLQNDAVPPAFNKSMDDFDLHCAFVGERIRTLRPADNSDGAQ